MHHHVRRSTHFNDQTAEIRAITNYDLGKNDPPVIPGIDLTYCSHDHDVYELVLVQDGEGSHVLEKKSFDVAKGDVFFIPPGMSHFFTDTQGLKIINLIFVPELADELKKQLSRMNGFEALFYLEPRFRHAQDFSARLHLLPRELSKACELCDRLLEEDRLRKEGFQIMMRSIFWELMVFLVRQYQRLTGEPVLKLIRLGPLLTVLQDRLEESWTLSQMAQKANMSVSTLRRAFLSTTGFSPKEYFINLRLEKGADLLQNSDLGIAQIADQSGFPDPNYFTRAFTKFFGISPREYRKGGKPLKKMEVGE